MKVGGTSSAAATGGATRSAKPSGEGFAPTAGSGVRETAASAGASSVGAVTSLDALLALQETPGPLERRKRAMKRAGGLLDVLDTVKLALLEGGDPGQALRRLSIAVRESRDETGDEGLENVLDHIETRAAVELAKDEMARRITGMAHDNSSRVAPSY